MEKSQFLSSIKIEHNVYAVFNRLMFNPVFASYSEMRKIKSNDFSGFSKSDINNLIKRGIVVKNEEKDAEALSYLKDYIESETKNKISLIYIIGNNNCNLGCKYCFIGKLNNEHPVQMEKGTLINALDKFNDHINECDLKKGIVVFYGAEPLINFELIRFATKYIKKNKYRMQISLVSNVTLLKEVDAKFIKNNNIGLGVSIDGPKHINDKNRVFYNTNNGTYDVVMEKIKMLKKLNVPFGLSVTISEDVLDNQEEYFEWIKSLKIEEVTYNLMHYSTAASNWESYYKRIAEFLFKSYKELGEYIIEGRIARKIDAFYKREFKYSDCGAVGANQICLKPNGDIVICHGLWNNKAKLGNINDIDIKDIFETKMYNLWHKNLTINKKRCLRCPFIYMCGGGCAMESKSMFGSEKKLDKPFCIYTKEISKLILKEFYTNSKINDHQR